MATTTAKLGVRKPAPADIVNVVTDVDGPYDKFDASVGFTVCTSATRPSTPFAGQTIYETDTHNYLLWSGTQWLHLTVPTVATTAQIINPWTDQVVYSKATQEFVRWTGSAWTAVYTFSTVSRSSLLTTLLGTGVGTNNTQASGNAQITTATSYADMTVSANIVGHSFPAPVSGKMKFDFGGSLTSSVASGSTVFVTYEVATGATVGGGTVVDAADDVTAFQHDGNEDKASMKTGFLAGLNPGTTYNVCLRWRQSGAATAIIRNPFVISQPQFN